MRVYSFAGRNTEGGYALAGKLVFPDRDHEQVEYERQRKKSDSGTGKRYRTVLGRGQRKPKHETPTGATA